MNQKKKIFLMLFFNNFELKQFRLKAQLQNIRFNKHFLCKKDSCFVTNSQNQKHFYDFDRIACD